MKNKPRQAGKGKRGGPSRRRWIFGALGAAVGIAGGGYFAARSLFREPRYGYRIVRELPHDVHAFTQGLVFEDGILYEGTGGYNGDSIVRKIDFETGEVLQESTPIPQFGEGITIWQDRLFQLTWESGIGHIYAKSTLERIGQFSYFGEGWGLTHDGERLILSDGQPRLRFLDPDSFREIGRIDVRWAGRLVENLNELEYIDGEVYANVWHTDYIVRIDPNSGNVVGRIELDGLRPQSTLSDEEAVANGIAYNPGTGNLIVTGKRWPKIFEIGLTRHYFG